jgi:Family of unknown function (DUF6116)
MPNPLVGPILGFLGRLSFPKLFAVTGGLFLLNLVVPDLIPFIDELLLGLGTLLLASLRKRGDDGKTPIEGQATKVPPAAGSPIAGRTIEGQKSRP